MEKDTALTQITDYRHDIASLEYKQEKAVIAAKAAGASWAEIGTALDLTKQRAHQKYADAVASAERVAKWAAENPEEAEAARARARAEVAKDMAQWKATQDHAQHVNATAIFLDGQVPAPRVQTPAGPVDLGAEDFGSDYPEQLSYDCRCGWTIVYPENEACEAMQDIYDHDEMHRIEDEREEANKPAQDALDQYGPSEATRRFHDKAQALGLEINVSLRADNDQLSVFAKPHNEYERQVMVSQFPGKDGKGYRHYYSYITSAAGDWKKCSYAKAVQAMQTYAAINVWTQAPNL